MLWTDEDNLQLIKDHYPWFLDTFVGYKENIKRADAVRYFILHRYGGIYMDLDFGCLRHIGSRLSDGVATFGIQNQFPASDIVNNIDFVKVGSVANAWMASAPNDPLFNHILSGLIPASHEEHVLHATGPQFLTKILHECANNTFHLLEMPLIYNQEWNSQNKCQTVFDCIQSSPTSYFATFWAGSWLEQNDSSMQ